MLAPIQKVDSGAYSFLLSGRSAVGKTTSGNTVPGSTLFINFESRNPTVRIDKADIVFATCEHFADVRSWLLEAKKLIATTKKLTVDNAGNPHAKGTEVKTVFLDSLHALQSVVVNDLLQGRRELVAIEMDEEARTKKRIASDADRRISTVNSTAMVASTSSPEFNEWGAMAHEMKEFVKSFCKLTDYGVNIIVSCLAADAPNYDRTLSDAPALLGKEFPKYVSSYFDGVCNVAHNIKTQGDKRVITWPSICIWEDPSDNLMLKYPAPHFKTIELQSGRKITPLDWADIFKRLIREG